MRVTPKRSLAVLLGLMTLAGCVPKPAETASTQRELPTVPVTVTPLTVKSIQRSVTAAGTLNGYDDVTISPQVGGRVAAIPVDIGEVVVPGQVLLEIDPRDYKTDVERAKRALDLELARLDLPALQSKEQFKPEQVPGVVKTLAGWENALREYKRITALSGISDRELRGAETDLKMAEAARNVALAEARAGLTSAWLRRDELDAAEQRLEYCTLRAPIPTGWYAWAAMVGPGGTPLRYSVAQKLVSEGQTIQTMPATSAFRLVIDRALKLPAPIPERFAAEVKLGQPVEVRVDAYPDHTFAGSIYRLTPTVDPSNRTFYVVVAVPNLDGRLMAGAFARATIRTRLENGVKCVPASAIVSYAGVDKIFIVDKNVARAIEVRLGVREKDLVEVIGPIPDGAVVITSGHSQLVDGSPLKIRE